MKDKDKHSKVEEVEETGIHSCQLLLLLCAYTPFSIFKCHTVHKHQFFVICEVERRCRPFAGVKAPPTNEPVLYHVAMVMDGVRIKLHNRRESFMVSLCSSNYTTLVLPCILLQCWDNIHVQVYT